ncbi:MAG: chaperone modulator CbpM [Kofleriaceae bacterium]
MTVEHYTYRHLIELVDGDAELIAELVEHGVITRHGDDRALVDVERVMVVRTLRRELEVDWSGIDVILHLRDELARARRQLAALAAARREGAAVDGDDDDA